MDKKVQWNLKDVPPDIFEFVIGLQSKLKIGKQKSTSIEKICYVLIRKGAGLTKETTKDES